MIKPPGGGVQKHARSKCYFALTSCGLPQQQLPNPHHYQQPNYVDMTCLARLGFTPIQGLWKNNHTHSTLARIQI